jgi:hypothetical protein
MAFSMNRVPKDYRRLVKAAIEQGWMPKVDGRGHTRLSKPGHRPLYVAFSPSDKRGLKNTVAQMRREGIDV